MNNTTLDESKIPLTCECGRLIRRPPGWLRLLAAMAPGKWGREKSWSVSSLAKATGISRTLTAYHADAALKERVLERAPTEGVATYRRTRYGQLILDRWKRAGWRG